MFYDHSKLCKWILLGLLLLFLTGSILLCLADPAQLRPTGHRSISHREAVAKMLERGLHICIADDPGLLLGVDMIGTYGPVFAAALICAAPSLILGWLLTLLSVPLPVSLLLLPLSALACWLLQTLNLGAGRILLRISLVISLLLSALFPLMGLIFLIGADSLTEGLVQELYFLLLAAIPVASWVAFRVWDP